MRSTRHEKFTANFRHWFITLSHLRVYKLIRELVSERNFAVGLNENISRRL